MGALEELIHYCNEKDPIGAMLLTGEWGCGKTYLIENGLTKALEKTHVIVKVSLFGMTDAGTLNSTVRQKWFEACTPILGQLRKAKEKSGGFLAALNTALHAINPLAGDAANVMVSMNMLDVVPIRAEVEDPKTMEKKIMIVVNTETIPGMKIVELKGLVQGNTVRAKNVGRDIAASFKNLVGGELKGYTELLVESRREAVARMIAQAEELQANAIVNVRFATSSITAGAAELYAYGTAVVAVEDERA